MADIAATDITVTFLEMRKTADRNLYNVQLAFGNGALTYPAGGVPVNIAKLGCPDIVESLTIYDKGTSGYAWSYDAANKKLVAVQAPVQTHAHDLLVKGGQAASTTNNIANYATAILGKQEATDATFAGSASATKGGVISATLAAAPGSQPSTVAIAAQVLKCEIIGW